MSRIIKFISHGECIGSIEAIRLNEQGDIVVCHKCGEPLLFVLDDDTAKRHRVMYGIYCPTSHSHVGFHFDYRDPDAVVVQTAPEPKPPKPQHTPDPARLPKLPEGVSLVDYIRDKHRQ